MVVLARDSGKTKPVILSGSANNQTDYPRPAASDALFAGKELAEDLGNDLSDAATLFAAARPRSQHAAAVADVFSDHRSAVADFAVAPLAGFSLTSTAGTVQAGDATSHAASANPGPASASRAGIGELLGPGRISAFDQHGPSWSSYAHDPQHTAISDVPAQERRALDPLRLAAGDAG